MKIAKHLIILFVFTLFACGTGKKNKQSGKVVETTEKAAIQDEKEIEVKDEEPEIIERPHYNPSATILTDIVHTTLHVSFDWSKSQLNGVAKITASPYFYSTDSLILDAKSMDIHSVKLVNKELDFIYNDDMFLRIGLDKEYTRDENYTIVIDYTAKPEEKKKGGSRAISSDKGLYFINPVGEDPNKMPQIWTQGETEASSVWFPTIDRPNQKMTQEIFITVEDKYVTLSNGRFVGSTKNDDGSRTDHWKQELPHAPYLAAMAVGEFKVVKDSYTRPDGTEMPVHYYVEPEWEEHAQAIFGVTPKMIKFFSELLDVEYPWDKYHQVVVRDYVSGAMENTGAVIFGDFVYKTKRELIDGNDQSIIAHELSHHWFGDLVTCESWANLPLNESFANYSQYLWDEFYYGEDQADYMAEREARGYFQSSQQLGHHDMIWYDYEEKEDMFDAHSYNKGGRILHMLRTYLGDEAFFSSLNLYLNTHEFKPVEIHHLRLAFEEISGEDLNWFFDQWFFGKRHPVLDVDMDLDTAKQVQLTIKQVQDLEKAPLYKLPMKIAIFDERGKTTHDVVIDKNIQNFSFDVNGELKNIIVDEDRVLLGTINFSKPKTFYLHQFYNAPKYKDREEGVTYGSRLNNEQSRQLIEDALSDDFWYIRQLAIGKLDQIGNDNPEKAIKHLEDLISNDSNSRVRAAALKSLASDYFDGKYQARVRNQLETSFNNDSSYLVVSRALDGFTKGTDQDVKKAMQLTEKVKDEPSSMIKAQIAKIYAFYGGEEHLDYFKDILGSGKVGGYEAIGVLGNFTKLLKGLPKDIQMKNLAFYEELKGLNSPYINAVLPMNVMMLKRDAESDLNRLNAELESAKSEDTKDEEDIKKDIAETEQLLEGINELLD